MTEWSREACGECGEQIVYMHGEPFCKCRKKEFVNHPDHYTQHRVECIEAIEEMDFCTGSAIKYLWRWKDKGGVQDLKKAKWYVERLIARESK